MKHSLLLSLLMFVCLGVFGKSSSVPPQKVTLDSLQSTIDSQQSTITTLQDSINYLKEDNAGLHEELKMLEQTIEQYRDYVEKNTSSIDKYLTWWFAVLSIIAAIVVGGLGVLGPYLMNRRSEENADKAIQKAKDAQNAVEEAQKNLHAFQSEVQIATTQATTATAQAENVRTALINNIKKVEEAVKKVEKTEKAADGAAKKAKAIQYFVQALQESDENRAIKLYDKCIDEDKDFAEAYNNRGFLRHKIDGPDAMKAAMDDYTTAITFFQKQGRGVYAEAYNNRGILFFENLELVKAKNDFDAAISKDYAEAYLNRGLLDYRNGNEEKAWEDFDNAINKNRKFAEAYYIKGLFIYKYSDNIDFSISNIVIAKTIKNDVVESYSNRSLLSGDMKELDNYINGVEYSMDMRKLIRVLKDKKNSFIIPSCVNIIGDSAFRGYTNITSIIIPDSVTEIEFGAFAGCTGLNQITVDNNNRYYCSVDGVLYSKNKKTLIAIPGGRDSIMILDSIEEIGEGAFNGCARISSIKIPGSVKVIGKTAFFICTNLTSIEIPESVKEIGYGAFYRCTSLTSIKILNGVTEIGDFAFYGCIGLTSINIPNSVTKIGESSFESCTSLESINIPGSVSKIGDFAFEGCTSLNSIKILENVIEIGCNTFDGCTSLTLIVIPESVTKIGIMAFDGCSSLNEIHLKHRIPVDFSDAFSELDRSKVIIYVPKGSGEAYRNSEYYKKWSGDRIQEENE